jgi:hypothetical protein
MAVFRFMREEYRVLMSVSASAVLVRARCGKSLTLSSKSTDVIDVR